MLYDAPLSGRDALKHKDQNSSVPAPSDRGFFYGPKALNSLF